MAATEIILIFLIYLLLFGAKGIPSLAKTMGKAMYQFREARNDIQREILDSAKDITDSAKDVRREVENAAKLAQNQAKKAQGMLEDSVKPEETKAAETPEDIKPINPLTPTDSISSAGLTTGSLPLADNSDSEESEPPTQKT